MCRGKTTLEQKAHRVALIAKSRLQPDKDLAELRTQHENAAPVALHAARRRAPGFLDFGQPRCLCHNLIRADMRGHIRFLPVLAGRTLQNHLAQRLDRGGRGQVIPLRRQGMQGVVQRLEHAQISRCASRACIGRKAEQDDRQSAIRSLTAAQQRLFLNTGGQFLDPLGAG